MSAVGAEHADKLGEHPFFHLATECCLPPVCPSALLSHLPYRDLCHRHSTARLAKNACFGYISELS